MAETYEVRQDPLTFCIAQRTVFPIDGDRAWLVFRLDRRTHYVADADVKDWVDLVPELIALG